MSNASVAVTVLAFALTIAFVPGTDAAFGGVGATYSGTLTRDAPSASHTFQNEQFGGTCAVAYDYTATVSYAPYGESVTVSVSATSFSGSRTTTSGFAWFSWKGTDCEEVTLTVTGNKIRDHKTITYTARITGSVDTPELIVICPPPCWHSPCPQPMSAQPCPM